MNMSLVEHGGRALANAVGLSGKDGGLLKVEKRYSEDRTLALSVKYYRSKSEDSVLIC